MPAILAILGMLAAAGFWLYRIRSANDAAREALDMANDVRLAAKRFAYKRSHKTHPIDGVDDPRLTAAGIMSIAAEMDGRITEKEQQVMVEQAASTFNCDKAEAEEMVVFGRWLASQGQNRDETFRRMMKRMISLGGVETIPDMIKMIEAVAVAEGQLNDDGIQDLIDRLLRAAKTGR
jgi:uncharacterized tellurite resistance protein B-like protein